MSGLFSYVSSLLGGGANAGDQQQQQQGGHGHTHGGEPCHGHGAPPPMMMGGGGGGGHGHTHGGQPCHGHGGPPPGMMMGGGGGGGGHGHTHGGQPCHGHGHSQEPMPLPKDFPFTRETLMTFMNRFLEDVQKPETLPRLREAIKAGKAVETATEEMQRDIMRDMGIDAAKGIEGLQFVQQMFPTDREVMQTFMQFVTSESMACDEAEMSPEEFEKKLVAMSEQVRQRQMMVVMQRAVGMGLGPEQQEELRQLLASEQDKLGLRPTIVQQQTLMMTVQAKLQQMLALSPEQEERLRKAAQERMEQKRASNPNMTDQQVIQQAMQRLQLASQMMKQSGMSEEQVTEELMKRLREGNFQVPPGMMMGGGHGHSHGPGEACNHGPGGAGGAGAAHHDEEEMPEELAPHTKVERS